MASTMMTLTAEDVLRDLEVGRSRPLVVPDQTQPVARPALGGPAFRATWATVQALGRVRPRMTRSVLETMWFTPWTVGRERDLPDGAVRRIYRHSGFALSGWELGEGRTVLLVHGWGGNSTDLANIGAALAAEGRRVVAIDLPAHGRSPGKQTDLLEMAAAVGAMGQLLGPLDAIVAHSLGSAATIQAMGDGMDTRRLVLLAPPDKVASAVASFQRQARLPEPVGEVLRDLIERRFGETVWEDLSTDRIAGQLDVDAMVVHDEGDRQVPAEASDRVAEALDADRLATSGLGHSRILVDRDVVQAVVTKVVA